jgi:hypothetical protein
MNYMITAFLISLFVITSMRSITITSSQISLIIFRLTANDRARVNSTSGSLTNGRRNLSAEFFEVGKGRGG